jgi:spermidine synthase
MRSALDLFLVSVLLLFLELACIRWFAAHVLFLTFFTNTVLLASFLGLSVGCLAAGHSRNFLSWTPWWLALALAAPHGVYYLQERFQVVLDVDHAQTSPQVVFFGTEYPRLDAAKFVVPIEIVAGAFFLLVALSFMGLGQQLGRALSRVGDRIRAYTLNILGSITGIGLFVAFSWSELSPFWWFLVVVGGLSYLIFQDCRAHPGVIPFGLACVPLLGVLYLADLGSGTRSGPYVALSLPGAPIRVRDSGHEPLERLQCFWSPYCRIDCDPRDRSIYVNLIIHQRMVARQTPYPAYDLPHLLQRDSGGGPCSDVLIIGAGSGNDVSRALQWGARHVDAVEIDPVILRLGRQAHPDRPYEDKRVTVHLDDGRNFLRTTDREYDLIVYALVDSLVLHSGYSNIRLESYLFTDQAFAVVRKRLKPGGLFVMYNNFRQGWVVARLQKALAATFQQEPLVLTLPHREVIQPQERWNGFTVLVAGDTHRLSQAFREQPEYWLRTDQAPNPKSPNGFRQRPELGELSRWQSFGLAQVVPPSEALEAATDDWPFLYLRGRMIPELSLRGVAVMGGLSLLVVLSFWRNGHGEPRQWAALGQMFLLGAGFMLVETKAVVQMALLFGSTWLVNAIVFVAVLVMILAANLFVLAVRPNRLWPFYLGLFGTLALACAVPLDTFLGMNPSLRGISACLLTFVPVFFAGAIFAVSLDRMVQPGYAFGANILGAMVGGLTEYTSMLMGFQLLGLAAISFYIASSFLNRGLSGSRY